MTPTVTPAVPVEDNSVEVVKNLFDLEKFEKRSVSKKITLDVAKEFGDILTKSGNDESEAVKTFNKGYRRGQIMEAKKSLMTDNCVSPKVVSGFVNQFRPMFPAKSDTTEGRKTQNQEIYAFIRSQPALLQAIKAIAAATANVEDESEDGDTNDTE